MSSRASEHSERDPGPLVTILSNTDLWILALAVLGRDDKSNRLALAAAGGHIGAMSRAAAFLFIVLAASPAFAQATQGGRPAYENDLQRLSEILGALHYLRDICGAREGQTWRNEMQALLEAEAPSGERKERLTASFNRGYRGFQQSYRTCTPAADFAIRRYLEEGAKIARDITARYAN